MATASQKITLRGRRQAGGLQTKKGTSSGGGGGGAGEPPRGRAKCGAPDKVVGADARRAHGGAQQRRARDEDAPSRAQHRQADGQASAYERPQEWINIMEHASPVLVDRLHDFLRRHRHCEGKHGRAREQ